MKTLIPLFFFFALSRIGFSQDITEFENLQKSSNYEDYEIFVNKYPATDKFEFVIKELTRLKTAYNDSFTMHPWDCFRNCCSFKILEKGSVIHNQDSIRIARIKEIAFDFLENKENNSDLSEKVVSENVDNIEVPVSKGVFSIWYELNAPLDSIQIVLIEINLAIEKYKESLKLEWCSKNKEFDILIDSLLAKRIIMNSYDESLYIPQPQFNFQLNSDSIIQELIKESENGKK